MVGGLLYLMDPLLLPVASMDFTILCDSWSFSLISPKTTCLSLSQLVGTVVMKNWEPFLQPCQPMATFRPTSHLRVWSGIGH